jgi:hypothetical protein
MKTYSQVLKREALKNKKIFWDIPKEDIINLSDAALVERILNYGNMDQFRNIVKDKESFTNIHLKIRNKKRCNLSPLTINYVDLYLRNNA